MFAVDVPMDGGAFVEGFALEFSPFYRYIDGTEKPDETCQTLGMFCKKRGRNSLSRNIHER
jgi:hypothetical protein